MLAAVGLAIRPLTLSRHQDPTPSRLNRLSCSERRWNDCRQTTLRSYGFRSLERMSFKDVAKQLNRSFDSVTKLWYRAILKLQQELDTGDESQVQE